jgi:putative transposase
VIVVKVRDGQVTNTPFHVVIDVTTAGERDILGGLGRRRRRGRDVLAHRDQEPRRARGVCIVVCDGLKGLPDAITTTWELAQVQTCVIHLILGRLPFRVPPGLGPDGQGPAPGLSPSRTWPGGAPTAVNADQAEARMEDVAERWQARYPAAVKRWRSA